MLEILKGKFKFKAEYVIVLVLICAVIFIFFIDFDKQEVYANDSEKFIAQTESKLKKSIENIKGVKSVTVSITVSQGIKTVIAEDVKEIEENGKITRTVTPVLVSGKPIVLGEIYPEIAGVVIICNCSDEMTVRTSVLDLVTTMLDLSCDKVRILTQ